MTFKLTTSHLLIIVIIVLSATYLAGLPAVPFHPDESTQIFMSADLELIFTQPTNVFWRSENSNDQRQRYRELDAPLTRYLIGVGRLAAGSIAPLSTDWDWTQSWQYNLDAGAFPGDKLLHTARIPLAFLFPFTLILLFLTAQSIAPKPTAWLAMLLYATHALVLLHTRRAMAEPVLLFTIILTLWSLVRLRHAPWWAAIPAALAFCAKHSAGIMIVPVIFAIFWQTALPVRQRVVQAALAGGLFIAIVFILNPFLWGNPLQAVRSALHQRADLVSRQVDELGRVNPEKVLDSFPTRLAAQVGQLFFIQPAIWDISNYAAEQHDEERAYLANPLHHLLRSPAGGVALMLFGLYGFVVGIMLAVQDPALRRALILIILANGMQLLTLLLFVPLPFQRYSLPLIPFICIWSAIGLWKIAELALTLIPSPQPRHRN
jgi:4-amino-4-deoxy-L-arabinose transferase-like glycosyltransferase